MSKILVCTHCGKETYGVGGTCNHCGESISFENWDEFIEQAIETGDWSEVPIPAVAKHAEGLILTTAMLISGRNIEKEIEIITAECAFGMNIFRDFLAGIRDVVGGRSGSIQKVLRDMRRVLLTELKREALMLGADAVIGVRIDYNEFSGGGKSMLFAVATGTAVKLR